MKSFPFASHAIRWVPLIILLIAVSCRSSLQVVSSFSDQKVVHPLKAYPQDTTGSSEKGFEYMKYGPMVGNGIPWEVNKKIFGVLEDTVFKREGLNAMLPHTNIAFEAVPGVPVVSGNCFTCHSQEINGKMVLGLGNSFSDYTRSLGPLLRALNFNVKRKYGKNSEEWETYEEQGKWYLAIAQATVMPNPGTNPAFRLEEAVVSYRNKEDLSFSKKKKFLLEKPSIGSDVPPLWNVKKKKALYYTGLGRGDFSKLLMQVSVLGVHDSTKAREIQKNFVDVMAWLNELEPPAYPAEISQELAEEGRKIFLTNCSKCHGTYGDNESYPNKIIPISKIQTDPVYAEYNLNSRLMDWYNESWFGQSTPYAHHLPSYGYVAPPLDGVWATAPYLHNGSVPDLWTLLKSSDRPIYWSRSGERDDFNFKLVGWNYKKEKNGKGKLTYDTTENGAGKEGHYFGDRLEDEERMALIEYLKTL